MPEPRPTSAMNGVRKLADSGGGISSGMKVSTKPPMARADVHVAVISSSSRRCLKRESASGPASSEPASPVKVATEHMYDASFCDPSPSMMYTRSCHEKKHPARIAAVATPRLSPARRQGLLTAERWRQAVRTRRSADSQLRAVRPPVLRTEEANGRR
jgi:hypothetical protein